MLRACSKNDQQTPKKPSSAPAQKEDNPHYREICAAWVRLTRWEKRGPRSRARKGPLRGPTATTLRPRRRPLLTRETPAATRVCVTLSNMGHKNVSTYKRRRLFHVITDFRPVNDFFESLTPPRSVAYYESLSRVSRLLPLDFTPRIGIDPPVVHSFEIEVEARRPVTNLETRSGEISSHRRIIVSQRFINRSTCNWSLISYFLRWISQLNRRLARWKILAN